MRRKRFRRMIGQACVGVFGLGVMAWPGEASTITAPGVYVMPRYTISMVRADDAKALDAHGSVVLRDAAGLDGLLGSGQNIVTWITFAIPQLAPGLELEAATIDVGGELISMNGVNTPGICVGWISDHNHADLVWDSRNLAGDHKMLRQPSNSGPATDANRYSANIMDWLRKPGQGPGTDLHVLQTWTGTGTRGWREERSYLGRAGHTNVTSITLTIERMTGVALGMHEVAQDAPLPEVAIVAKPRGGRLVGGYQEIYGFVWSAPGIGIPFAVQERTVDGVTMASGTLADDMQVERHVSLIAGQPGFHIQTRLRNAGDQPLIRGVRTHPMLRNGDMADNHFVFRDGAGNFASRPMPVLEALSADFGPTGLWAAINTRTNRGILWESPPRHNGAYIRASSSKGGYFCVETFSEHARLEPGETLVIDQTFTLLRDARAWCERHGIALSFGE